MPKEITDNRAEYYAKSADNRAEDSWEWQRRVQVRLAFQQGLYPKPAPRLIGSPVIKTAISWGKLIDITKERSKMER